MWYTDTMRVEIHNRVSREEGEVLFTKNNSTSERSTSVTLCLQCLNGFQCVDCLDT